MSYFRQSQALLNALGIRLGRKIALRAASLLTEDKQIILLFPRSTTVETKQGIFSPIPYDFVSDTTFLKMSTEYFLKTDATNLIHYFERFWDSQDMSWNSMCLHLTTGIEGLMDIISENAIEASGKNQETIDNNHIAYRKQFKEFKKLVKDTIISLATEETQIIRDRFLDAIQHVRTKAPHSDLIETAQLINAQITDIQAKSWEELRNFVAHGGILNKESTDQLWNFYDCVGVLHTIVLSMIGWTGPTIDYSAWSKKGRENATQNSGNPQ